MKKVLVLENWTDKNPVEIGSLYIDDNKGRETYSFEYSESWLDYNGSVQIDPMLPLQRGRMWNYPSDSLFGVFTDSAPDRWGRTLINRYEALKSKEESRPKRSLGESDYLLSVDDRLRSGAIRLYDAEKDEFYSSGSVSIPPLASLRELEQASISFEKDVTTSSWIKELLLPGSSLGGARPKANVIDEKGELWIAKFPSVHDRIIDVGAWERVTQLLAKECGLNVPETDIKTFTKEGSTFLSKRFDREGERRVHFSSAMTLLGLRDGESDNASYIDILNILKSQGASPASDAIELWRRMVFNVAVSNTDNHLRNHGFILTEKGWKLSPLFDVNPNCDSNYSSLSIDGVSNILSYDSALTVAAFFDIDENTAQEEVERISGIVQSHWKSLAKKIGIKKEEIKLMEGAFIVQ